MTKDMWLAFALALCAYTIRTSGIVLVLAIGIYLILERRYKPAVILGMLFAPLFLALGTGGRYVSILLQKEAYNPAAGNVSAYDLIARATENFVLYVTQILPQALVPWSAWAGLCGVLGIVIVYLLIKGAKNG